MQRRSVLGGAGAGMALLLSGLLSSGMSDEADAREGAAGGRIGGRRGKNRRGHDKNRNNGHKRKKNKHNAPGLGSSSWIYVRMVVENLTSADIDFEGLALYEEFAGKICRVKALQTIRPNEAISFAPVDHEGVPTSALQAVLDDKYLVEAAQEQSRNSEFPVVWAFSNIVDSNVPGCKTGTRSDVFNRKMGVGQKLPFTLGSQKFELLRENDIDNARLFRLRVLAS